MEVGGSILDVFDDELSYGNGEDAEMMDVEEGEVVDGLFSVKISEENGKELDAQMEKLNNQTASNINKKKKKKKRKNKNKNANPTPGPARFDLDRFVIGVCKRLKEKKSYLVYTAVGVLGASAFGDLVKEVDAIQACGGQKTAEGDRYRNGGGILWNILKTRDPNAYKEIMKKGRDFEKQFRRPITAPQILNNVPLQDAGPSTMEPITNDAGDNLEMKTSVERQSAEPKGNIRRSVHDRIRVPVSYDDLPGESPEDQLS